MSDPEQQKGYQGDDLAQGFLKGIASVPRYAPIKGDEAIADDRGIAHSALLDWVDDRVDLEPGDEEVTDPVQCRSPAEIVKRLVKHIDSAHSRGHILGRDDVVDPHPCDRKLGWAICLGAIDQIQLDATIPVSEARPLAVRRTQWQHARIDQLDRCKRLVSPPAAQAQAGKQKIEVGCYRETRTPRCDRRRRGIRTSNQSGSSAEKRRGLSEK